MAALCNVLVSARHMLGQPLARAMLGERICDIVGASDFGDADFAAGH